MTKPKVLIIDDELDYCLIMKSYFKKRHYDAFTAYTIRDGLHLIDDLKPDIIFLDNNLPDGQGWPHVSSLVEKFPQLRIYLVSAYHQKKDFHSPSPNVVVWEKPLSISLLNDNF
jgi:DNA-binding response OmpR family regulator